MVLMIGNNISFHSEIRKMFLRIINTKKLSGPACSKLTTSLVNVPLKFQRSVSEICQYFLLKKYHFFIKNISIFVIKSLNT